MRVVSDIIWHCKLRVVKPSSWITSEDKEFPPETPRSCWYRSWLLHWRSGKEGVSPEPGCADLLAFYRGHRESNMSWGTRASAWGVFFVMEACIPVSQPFEVDCGDVEHNTFKPEDHEETLREGTVADAFSVIACLHTNKMMENKSERLNNK